MNEKVKQLVKIYGKTPDEIIEQLADRELRNGPPEGLGPRIMWLRGVNGLTRDALAEATGADVVQVIGSKFVLYRKNKKDPKIRLVK